MRFIKKEGHEPIALRDYKRQIQEGDVEPQDTFDDLSADARKALQQQLAREQGYLCCYCMREIKTRMGDEGKEIPLMRIEHFKPQSIFNGQITRADLVKFTCDEEQKVREDLRVDYYNLFCACPENKANKDRHCDVKKDKYELCIIPNLSDNKHKRFFEQLRYTDKGKIIIPENCKKDFEDKLNLNCESLVDKRAFVWKAISKELTRAAGHSNWNQGGLKLERKVQALLEKYKNPRKNGKYYQFRDFILYRLRKRFPDIRIEK